MSRSKASHILGKHGNFPHFVLKPVLTSSNNLPRYVTVPSSHFITYIFNVKVYFNKITFLNSRVTQ